MADRLESEINLVKQGVYIQFRESLSSDRLPAAWIEVSYPNIHLNIDLPLQKILDEIDKYKGNKLNNTKG